MRSKSVKVDLSYPVLYENVFHSPRINDIGLYYLSRRFGDNETLLYIGKTSSSFYNRLLSHKEWFEQYKGKRLVRLGIIVQPKNYDDGLIADIESALIHEMQPFENTDKKNWYSFYNMCEITNTGYRGLLPTTIFMKDHIRK